MHMETAHIAGTTLAFETSGNGDPVLLIHGALIADAFRPLLIQPPLVDSYRLIAFHRRGYTGSSPVPNGFSLKDQAADCEALLTHLNIPKVHVVGHSFGGAVALQLALDAPVLVRSLTLLEPALILGNSGEAYRTSLSEAVRQFRSGDPAAVVDAMLQARWPEYRERLNRVLPGAFEEAVASAHAAFESELPALLDWAFSAEELHRVSQPMLSVLGGESESLSPRFAEAHYWLLENSAGSQGYVLPGAHHFLQVENPVDMADALTAFWTQHPI
jgi:pimeloyl-ACP methyl ester carboxylesterase